MTCEERAMAAVMESGIRIVGGSIGSEGKRAWGGCL